MKQLLLSLALSRSARIFIALLSVRFTHVASVTLVILLLLFSQTGQAADPLDIWTWRNPLPTANDLIGVSYAGGQFVVVGAAGTILTSTETAGQ